MCMYRWAFVRYWLVKVPSALSLARFLEKLQRIRTQRATTLHIIRQQYAVLFLLHVFFFFFSVVIVVRVFSFLRRFCCCCYFSRSLFQAFSCLVHCQATTSTSLCHTLLFCVFFCVCQNVWNYITCLPVFYACYVLMYAFFLSFMNSVGMLQFLP